eukprot:5102563-Pyramimonas_sp.AAC.1
MASKFGRWRPNLDASILASNLDVMRPQGRVTLRRSDLWRGPTGPPPIAEGAAIAAACAPRFGPPAPPLTPRTKGHPCPAAALTCSRRGCRAEVPRAWGPIG